ncbi:hypothetical protein LX32DRAFT_630483 [Colletotrichum zoysiae]|uniref:DNA/RNA-binding domain-containing protein n=1 Tax=Colletotrichum zoysiae TaxID=1216348 RepID=A0AAD9H673_9PEZI|nr:hypothetical protein LX32DRAFT_630483 [Colletotrichum zoysiae]
MKQDTTSRLIKHPRKRRLSRCRRVRVDRQCCTISSPRPPRRGRVQTPIHERALSRTFQEKFYRGPTPKTGPIRSPREGGSKAPEAPLSPHPRTSCEPPFVVNNANSTGKQPETRSISQDLLAAEVKGIYAGLVMVESKCIEIDNAQSTASESGSGSRISNEQWRALIAFHRAVLHEHHEFFPASQHPSASPPLRRLATKYAMPARTWRHGIHSFLELLRQRLPGSLEHVLTFIYLACSTMALLYETVPTFEDTWQCLGGLGRHRMTTEDDDVENRELWTSLSRRRYSKASKHAMPARMWRHGIHSFLEPLHHRLPPSLESTLTFIYLAYSMMALLYGTVPAFEDTSTHGIHSFLEPSHHRPLASPQHMSLFIYLAYSMMAWLYETVPLSILSDVSLPHLEGCLIS